MSTTFIYVNYKFPKHPLHFFSLIYVFCRFIDLSTYRFTRLPMFCQLSLFMLHWNSMTYRIFIDNCFAFFTLLYLSTFWPHTASEWEMCCICNRRQRKKRYKTGKLKRDSESDTAHASERVLERKVPPAQRCRWMRWYKWQHRRLEFDWKFAFTKRQDKVASSLPLPLYRTLSCSLSLSCGSKSC